MKPSVGSNCVFRVFPGERERDAPLSPPSPEGMQGSGAPHARAVGNKSRQENSLLRRELKSPPEQLRESARGSQPSRTPSGVRERSAPRSCRQKQRPQKNSLHRRERISPPEQLRESARGSQPSRSRHPRGCRGAERPTLVSSGTKVLKRTACFVGNQFLHQNSPGELEKV